VEVYVTGAGDELVLETGMTVSVVRTSVVELAVSLREVDDKVGLTRVLEITPLEVPLLEGAEEVAKRVDDVEVLVQPPLHEVMVAVLVLYLVIVTTELPLVIVEVNGQTVVEV
jgi:hypothetical protein